MKLDPDRVNATARDEFERLQREESMRGDSDGNVLLHGVRFNIMGADYFMAGIYQSLYELYGKGAGGILRRTGKGYGAHLIEQVTADHPSDRFGQFLGLLAFLGYSLPRVESDMLVFPSSPTAEEYAKTTYPEHQVCYFLAGILTGAAGACDEGECVFVEETCQADGDDVCTFRIRSDP